MVVTRFHTIRRVLMVRASKLIARHPLDVFACSLIWRRHLKLNYLALLNWIFPNRDSFSMNFALKIKWIAVLPVLLLDCWIKYNTVYQLLTYYQYPLIHCVYPTVGRSLLGRAVHQPHLHLWPPASHVSISQRTSVGARAYGTLRALYHEERSLQLVHGVEWPFHSTWAIRAASQSKISYYFHFKKDFALLNIFKINFRIRKLEMMKLRWLTRRFVLRWSMVYRQLVGGEWE